MHENANMITFIEKISKRKVKTIYLMRYIHDSKNAIQLQWNLGKWRD